MTSELFLSMCFFGSGNCVSSVISSLATADSLYKLKSLSRFKNLSRLSGEELINGYRQLALSPKIAHAAESDRFPLPYDDIIAHVMATATVWTLKLCTVLLNFLDGSV